MKFDNFLDLMDTLLGENGCPWDREQTHESLRQYMLEECYEAIEAINNNDMPALKEELGDVLLQTVFHAKLAEKAGTFTIDDVIAGVSHKLISRHTHVFGADTATSASDVVDIWEANKQKERDENPAQAMAAVPKALPALVRASKVLKRSKQEKPATGELFKDIHASLANLEQAQDGHCEILGRLLLQLAGLSDSLGVNAEFSLTNAVERFIETKAKSSP